LSTAPPGPRYNLAVAGPQTKTLQELTTALDASVIGSPAGFLTEDGPAPWLAGYGLVEMPTASYPARTEANVRGSDATLWFGTVETPGARATLRR